MVAADATETVININAAAKILEIRVIIADLLSEPPRPASHVVCRRKLNNHRTGKRTVPYQQIIETLQESNFSAQTKAPPKRGSFDHVLISDRRDNMASYQWEKICPLGVSIKCATTDGASDEQAHLSQPRNHRAGRFQQPF